MPVQDEVSLLDDNRYVADVMYDIKALKAKEGAAPKLLFKKKMFRETGGWVWGGGGERVGSAGRGLGGGACAFAGHVSLETPPLPCAPTLRP